MKWVKDVGTSSQQAAKTVVTSAIITLIFDYCKNFVSHYTRFLSTTALHRLCFGLRQDQQISKFHKSLVCSKANRDKHF